MSSADVKCLDDIGSVSRLLEIISSYIGTNTTSPSWKTRLLFRGHKDANYQLTPGAFRIDPETNADLFTEKQERFLAREFRARAMIRHTSCPEDSDYPGWLALMQHYRLPTRLLDWSFSPLVALYFATESYNFELLEKESSEDEPEGCVWVLNPPELNKSQGWQRHIYPMDAETFSLMFRGAFKDLGGKTGRKIKDATGEPILWENKVGVCLALEKDPRMQLQQGAFSIHTLRTPLNKLDGNSEYLVKIPIPARAKWSLRRELLDLGITTSYLFPDLDSLSLELKFRAKYEKASIESSQKV